MGMRVRQEVPERSRPRYVVTRLNRTWIEWDDDARVERRESSFYVVDLHDKARCIWKVTGGHPNSSKTRAARIKAEQIARQMNSSYERGLRAALGGS